MIATAVALGIATLTGPSAGAHASVADHRPAGSHHAHARLTAAQVEGKVVSLMNAKRAGHGCNALNANNALHRAAKRHTNKMAAAHSLSHQLPGEPSLGRRISRAGYKHWTSIGENIAYGYPTARAVMRGWMHSAPHRANILHCGYKDIGVSYVVDDGGTAWWTADFASR